MHEGLKCCFGSEYDSKNTFSIMHSSWSSMHVVRGLTQPPIVPHSVEFTAASVAASNGALSVSPSGCSAASRHSVRAAVPSRYRSELPLVTAAASAAAGPMTSGTHSDTDQRREAKQRLLQQIAGTDRGSTASSWQRALVAEAQVQTFTPFKYRPPC